MSMNYELWLLICIENASVDNVQTLLKRDILDLNYCHRSSLGQIISPLEAVCMLPCEVQEEALVIFKELLAAGADVNYKTASGSALSSLCKSTWSNTGLDPSSSFKVKLWNELCQQGADVHQLDSEGNTLLHVLVDSLNHDLGPMEHTQIPVFLMGRLIAQGVDLEIRNANGDTALHLACSRHLRQLVGWLIEQGADPHARSGLSVAERVRKWSDHAHISDLIRAKDEHQLLSENVDNGGYSKKSGLKSI